MPDSTKPDKKPPFDVTLEPEFPDEFEEMGNQNAHGHGFDFLIFLATLFIGCSFAGLAKYYWDSPPDAPHPPLKRVFGAFFLSGVAGVITAMALHSYLWVSNPFLLSAISLTSGVGGASSIDFLMGFLKYYAEKFKK